MSTADDREALVAAIGYEPVAVSIDGHPEVRLTYRTVEDRDGLVERILAAGFTRSPQPAPSVSGRQVRYAWHDVTCPEGVGCRERYWHTYGSPIVNTGTAEAFLKSLGIEVTP